MEYAIAIFVGLWVAAAGLFSYARLLKDFREIPEKTKNKEGIEE